MSSTNNNQKQQHFAGKVQFRQFGAVLAKIKPFGAYQIFVCICILFAQIEWNGKNIFIEMQFLVISTAMGRFWH